MAIAAKTEADRVIATYWEPLDPDGYRVDPISIARKLGINVYEVAMDNNVSAVIAREEAEGAVDIFLNDAHSSVRQRFSCAHELGHYFAHINSPRPEGPFFYKRDERSSCGTHNEEIFANQFAANLLMPETKVRRAIEMGNSDLQIASLFRVSLEAVRHRLLNLELAA